MSRNFVKSLARETSKIQDDHEEKKKQVQDDMHTKVLRCLFEYSLWGNYNPQGDLLASYKQGFGSTRESIPAVIKMVSGDVRNAVVIVPVSKLNHTLKTLDSKWSSAFYAETYGGTPGRQTIVGGKLGKIYYVRGDQMRVYSLPLRRLFPRTGVAKSDILPPELIQWIKQQTHTKPQQ